MFHLYMIVLGLKEVKNFNEAVVMVKLANVFSGVHDILITIYFVHRDPMLMLHSNHGNNLITFRGPAKYRYE